MTMVAPHAVFDTLKKYMLVDGFDFVFDMERSQGCTCVDKRTGDSYLDMFSMFASAPVGYNHPKLREEAFQKKLLNVAINNITNSDIYSTEIAEFVQRFFDVAVNKDHFKYLFMIAGGGLAVENAIKAAFDWKVRKNFAKGIQEEKGHKVIHFKEAFHGRTGYTLSLTNTADPNKYKYFARFDWPRIDNPKICFPLDDESLRVVQESEAKACEQIQRAFDENPDEIAAIIIEPIQGEGGDNHFRPEFLQKLQEFCHNNDALFILDEVQSGMGLTGTWWVYEQLGIQPDIIAFGKKSQVCGILTGPRIDEVGENVFKVGSRLNSTWGGTLVDMVRCHKYLDIIEEENLIQNAQEQGKFLLESLQRIQKDSGGKVLNARGRGLMCAVDLKTPEMRDQVRSKMYENKIIILPSGTHSIRFRPCLNVTREELIKALDAFEKCAKEV